MQTARDFLSILERDYHLDFSGSRGSSVETLLRQFVAANRVEARDQGQALMATANANLLHELQAKDKTVGQLTEANDKSAEERDAARLEALHLKQETAALKAEIAAIHSVADAPKIGASYLDDGTPSTHSFIAVEAPKEEN